MRGYAETRLVSHFAACVTHSSSPVAQNLTHLRLLQPITFQSGCAPSQSESHVVPMRFNGNTLIHVNHYNQPSTRSRLPKRMRSRIFHDGLIKRL